MTENRFGNVWDALEHSLADAASMKARSDILVAIQSAVGLWGLERSAAAARLGLTQPRFDELTEGCINAFDLDTLVAIASAAGLSVAWTVTRPAA